MAGDEETRPACAEVQTLHPFRKYTAIGEDGLCTECRALPADASTSDSSSPDFARELEVLMQAQLQRKGRYHALVLLSGGKDSAYILQRLKAEFPGISILCVLVNNGFMSPVAIDSARHVSKKLAVDLLVVHSETARFERALRQAFLDMKEEGAYGVVDKADGDLIFAIGRDIAREMNIPVMIGGLTWVQLQKIFHTNDFKLELAPGVLDVHPLAVWRTDEQEIRRQVRALGLLPKGADSPVVSNNSLIITMSALDVMNLGYCSFEPEFAQLVREKKTDRDYWLHTFEQLEFATKKGMLKKEIDSTLAKLNLSIADILKSTAP